jgi:hypothetical protein
MPTFLHVGCGPNRNDRKPSHIPLQEGRLPRLSD